MLAAAAVNVVVMRESFSWSIAAFLTLLITAVLSRSAFADSGCISRLSL